MGQKDKIKNYRALIPWIIASLVALLFEYYLPDIHPIFKIVLQYSCYIPIALQSVNANQRETTREYLQNKYGEKLRNDLVKTLIAKCNCTTAVKVDNISIRIFRLKSVFGVKTHLIAQDWVGWFSYRMTHCKCVALDLEQDAQSTPVQAYNTKKPQIQQGENCFGECSDENYHIFRETKFIAVFPHVVIVRHKGRKGIRIARQVRYVVCIDSKEPLLEMLDDSNRQTVLSVLQPHAQLFLDFYRDIVKEGGKFDEVK